MNETTKELKCRLHESGALLEGHFALSSGLHSGHYMQCALFLRYPSNAAFAGKLLAEAIKPAEPDFILSPALGGLVIGHEVARHLGVPFLFCERKEGEMKLRRFPCPETGRFIVVEDVITTGRSSLEAAEAIGDCGRAIWLGTACIVNRSGGESLLPESPYSLWHVAFPNYLPAECPYCRRGIPLMKPGSRQS
ncbi:MAG: orotate phosphoribosyltransferase [Thermovirgaceae bacterium]